MINVAFLIAALSFSSSAAEKKYPVSEISEQMKENANAVYRVDEATFTIEAKNKAVYRVHQVVTILNEKGNTHADFAVGYDKLRKVNSLKATLYDAAGNTMKKLKSSDFTDVSAISSGSLFEDDRVKYADLSQAEYPYTVEIEYELIFNFLFYIPTWSVVPGYNASVERSNFELVYPTALAPRYKEQNITTKPVRKRVDSERESISWSHSQVKAWQKEYMSPGFSEIAPKILAAPTIFQYESYSGTMDTWQKFGQWQLSLLTGRTELPEQLKKKVAELTSGKKTTEEKTKALYEYLQNKTRYVSVQLGIGGFQPFDVKTVDQNGYGDCKALSNYMVAMLKEAGIRAHYTLISAGDDEDIYTDFPSTQFNHVIAMVPNNGDTLWLECTSQTTPFGYMGKFTGDRHALAITEEGGKIVKTPTYKAEVNQQVRKAIVKLEITGDGQAEVKTIYRGLQSENGGLHFVSENSADELRKWAEKNTDIPNFEIQNLKIKTDKNKIPQAVIDLKLKLRRLASSSGKRLFLSPNLMNRFSFVPGKVEDRKTEVVWTFDYEDVDTVQYEFPENLYPEFVPQPVKLTSRFGEYEAKFEFKEGKVLYVRRMRARKGRYPVESYQELIDFYKNVTKADNIKLVFLNKT